MRGDVSSSLYGGLYVLCDPSYNGTPLDVNINTAWYSCLGICDPYISDAQSDRRFVGKRCKVKVLRSCV